MNRCKECNAHIELWKMVYPLFRRDYVVATNSSGAKRKVADAPVGSHTGHFCKDGKWKSSSDSSSFTCSSNTSNKEPQ